MRYSHRPTDEELVRLASFVGHLESRSYFFGRLENPEWLVPLQGRGFFADLPAPRPGSEPGSTQFPPWPEGRYLVRMAPRVPDAVASILKDLPRSENPTVTRSLLEAAGALPKEYLRRTGHKVVDWVKAPHAGYFADEAASAISRLLQAGAVGQADRAARALLSLRKSPDSGPSWKRVVGRFREWQYKRVVATLLPAFVDEAGLKGVKLFSWLLGKVLRLAKQEGQPSEWDERSIWWRPAVEDHEQNQEHGVRHVLVSATRDAATRHAAGGDSELEETIRHLESRCSVLQRRIALHVLATTSRGADLAGERIGDWGLFDDHRLRHEYAELVRKRYSDISIEAQQAYFARVEEGPDLEEGRHWAEVRGSESSAEQQAEYVGRWQRDRLSFAADHLRGDPAAHYRQLLADFGEPQHPDFPVWRGKVMLGDTSPRGKDEMAEWSPTTVIEYLRDWSPEKRSDWMNDHSKVGLGRVFKSVVEERVSEFVPYSTVIGSLDPTYVRSFLEALGAASKGGVVFSWVEPLKLLAALVRYPSDASDEVSRSDPDPDWRPTRQALVWLLQAGFSSSDSRIPFDLREAAWGVLEPLTTDPEPAVGSEATDVATELDPHHWSINTVRGSALHAVVEYALWCRRALDVQGDDTGAGFALMPEVREILERHLDPRIEPTLTVRSVYGRWLPWLFLLDEDWVVANLGRIFPTDPELAGLRDVAWSTYIGWCPAYDSAFPPLRSEYEAAVDRVPSGGTFGISGDEDIDVKLGEHLVVLYWRRVAPRSLLHRFFQRVADDQAGAVMEYVGGALLKSEEVADSVCHRIQELWGCRIDVITADPGRHGREAQAFSITFAAAKLDTKWELDHFERVLHTHPGSTAYTRRVIERLAHLAEDDPVTATRLTLTLLQGADNEWNHLHWRKHVRSVLVAAGDNVPDETVETRGAIIDHYVSRGEFDFRGLL